MVIAYLHLVVMISRFSIVLLLLLLLFSCLASLLLYSHWASAPYDIKLNNKYLPNRVCINIVGCNMIAQVTRVKERTVLRVSHLIKRSNIRFAEFLPALVMHLSITVYMVLKFVTQWIYITAERQSRRKRATIIDNRHKDYPGWFRLCLYVLTALSKKSRH